MNALIDTNVLVYAWGVDGAAKQAQAIQVLAAHRVDGALALQSLSEFAAVMLRKGKEPSWIERVLAEYRFLWPVLTLTPGGVEMAVRAAARFHLSFWDAQIWAVARSHGISTILSEDGPSGQTVEGVAFVNPFSPGPRNS